MIFSDILFYTVSKNEYCTLQDQNPNLDAVWTAKAMLGKGGMQIFTFGRYNANINLSTFIAERYAAALYLNIFLVINGRFTILHL